MTSWRNAFIICLHIILFYLFQLNQDRSVSPGKNKIACQVLTWDLIFALEARYFIHCSLAGPERREVGGGQGRTGKYFTICI